MSQDVDLVTCGGHWWCSEKREEMSYQGISGPCLNSLKTDDLQPGAMVCASRFEKRFLLDNHDLAIASACREVGARPILSRYHAQA
jgi:hypothetical protein